MEPYSDNNEDACENAVHYFIKSRGANKIDKKLQLHNVEVLTRGAKNGLPSNIIKTLAESVVFTNNFDINTRRRLVYCLIPQSKDFPYTIIPLAVSIATSTDVSPTMQQCILKWLAGLLEYQIIDESHKMVHVCYTSLFGLLSHANLSTMASKILSIITRREDVTFHRTQLLLKQKNKLGLYTPNSALLRIYQVFRPDLVVVPMMYIANSNILSKLLKESLTNARNRIEADFETADNFLSKEDIWPELRRTKKINPFTSKHVLPQPEILVYTDSIEEKKEKKISVLEYRKIKDMISNTHKWRDWRWPNNSSCLLWKPAAISLFKPHDLQIKVSISNWMELALRTEIVEQIGPRNISRQLNLLEACIELVKHTNSSVPAVYYFLIEFLAKWDQHSFMSKILELISSLSIPFAMPAVFFESIFEKFNQLLSSTSIAMWCHIISAFTNLAISWALDSHELTINQKRGTWPLHLESYSPLELIVFLTKRMERVFMATVLRLGAHPLILNTIISHYIKINYTCCEKLKLPIIVSPPTELILIALANCELTSLNRIGFMMCQFKNYLTMVVGMKPDGNDRYLKSVSLYQRFNINMSITFFLDCTNTSKGFTAKWIKHLSKYFSPQLLKNLTSLENIRHFGSCSRAMVFSPFLAEDIKYKDFDINNHNQRENQVRKIFKELNSRGINGINECSKSFIDKRKD